jgi:hypothetical protein
MAPYRTFNRSQRVRLGSKPISPSATTLVNIENKRVQRDIARHSTLGAINVLSAPFLQDDSGLIDSGGVVTVAPVSGTGLVASDSAIAIRTFAGVASSGAASTVTLTAPTTTPRVDLLSVTLAAPQTLVKTDGTAAASNSAFNLGGRPAVPATSVALAYVVVPATISATVVVATDVWTLTAHGLTVGQKLVVATKTTITLPNVGTTLYVNSVPSANTFTLSATPGGANFDTTAADGSATFYTTDPVVIDARNLNVS